MRLYEYEAKEFLRKGGVAIPAGRRATSPDEAAKIAQEIGGRVVLKAQVLTGGRGKAGGIQFASSPDEAAKVASELLRKVIKGYPVQSLLVEPALEIAKEYYLGVSIDRVNYRIVVIGCAEGGVEIEAVAKQSPDKIIKQWLAIDEPYFTYQGIELALSLGFEGKNVSVVAGIAQKLVQVFYDTEAKLVEINPLALLKDGSIIAADARMSVDEDAVFRHGDLQAMGVDNRHEEGEMTEREKWARDNDIPYLDLDGDIGMFPGGAGFGIAGNDLIIDLGGQPANFMDSGGGPSPERLSKMLMLLQENPKVRAIFGARFGGVSRCDDFAKGVVLFLKTGKLTKPVAMRMTGNMWQEGLKIFEDEKKANPEMFRGVEIFGIETPIEKVARRAIELAAQEAR